MPFFKRKEVIIWDTYSKKTLQTGATMEIGETHRISNTSLFITLATMETMMNPMRIILKTEL